MPNRLTRFRDDWLNLEDKNGTKISEWCMKGKDDFSAYCGLCKTTINIGNGGKTLLMQHSSTSKHKSVDKLKNDRSQSRLLCNTGSKGVSLYVSKSKAADPKQAWILNEADKICHSEIIWTITVALNNYSFLSCDSIKQAFISMFPNSLANGMKICSRKVAYTISHGLGPYFLKQVTDEFNHEHPFFTLLYDETLNEQHLKQLDVYVRYWDSKDGCISERYIGSELMGHATALDIFSSIVSILKFAKIGLKGLIMLGSDGPNVNKSVFHLMDKEVKLIREYGLINVGTCNLHIIHNAFGHGLKIEEFGNIIDFLENIHSWFSKFPSRQEDLQKQVENLNTEYGKVLRYVSNRWLSVVKVCQRILDLFPALKAYFLQDLPKEKSRLVKLDRYKSIKNILDNCLTPVYLKFIVSVGSVFEHFIKLLQEKETLIHILYDELGKLLLKVMRRFVDENILKDKEGEKLLSIDLRKDALSAKAIDVGNSTKKALISVGHNAKTEFLLNAKEFYISVTEYLQQRLPLNNKLLQCLQILHPVIRKEPAKCTLPHLRRLANLLPEVIHEDAVDKVTDEWHRYVHDSDVEEEWSTKPIDYFWNKVFSLTDNSGNYRYPHLTTLVKSALTFSHGQASVERGFSLNKRIVTSERSNMSIETIRGLRIIKDAVKGKAADVCVTQEMIKFYKEAYAKFRAQKDAEKKHDKEKNPPKINPPVKKTAEEKLKALKEDISSAQTMIEEGSQRLKNGLKRKSMPDIEAAQALIAAGNKRLKAAQDEIAKKITV